MIITPKDKYELGFEEARRFILSELTRLAEDPVSAVVADTPTADPERLVFSVHRIEVPVIHLDLLSWLSHQKNTARFFWKGRDDTFACAGVGLAWDDFTHSWGEKEDIWATLEALLASDDDLRVFAGMCFHKVLSGPEWKTFKSIRFFVPRFELGEDKEGTRFACNVILGAGQRLPLKHVLSELESLKVFESFSRPRFQVMSRHNGPNFEQWTRGVGEALQQIQTGQLDKVVMSRRVTMNLDHAIDPCFLLDKLLQQQPVGFAFLFQFADAHAFLGLSPEQLYSRRGDQIRSEAVAGTRIRGIDTHQDEELRCELLSSDKERREHHFVLANVVNAFRQVCRSYAVEDEGEILRLSRQQHLLTRISGKLSEGVTDRELCAALHPTPAVGGSPTDKALQFLQRVEEFDRGWFAGPVGWFRRSSAELTVAIRSGLIENNCFHLYSGAGIVEGSNPLAEWEETEAKIRQYLDVLYGH